MQFAPECVVGKPDRLAVFVVILTALFSLLLSVTLASSVASGVRGLHAVSLFVCADGIFTLYVSQCVSVPCNRLAAM